MAVVALSLFVCAALPCSFTNRVALGQDDAPAEQPSEVATEAEIRDRMQEVEGSTELDDATKAKIKDLYEQALAALITAGKSDDGATRFEQMVATAETDLADAQSKLDALSSQPEVEIPDDLTLAELEERLDKDEEALAKLKEQAAGLAEEPARRQTRRAEIPSLSNAAGQQLSDLEQQLAAEPPSDELPALTTARQTQLETLQHALKQEILEYEKELAAYEATGDLLVRQQDLTARQVAHAEQQAENLRARVNAERQKQAEQKARQARLEAAEAARAHPVLKPLAERNQALAEAGQEAVEQIEEVSSKLRQTEALVAEFRKEAGRVRESLDNVGLTDAIGMRLRKHRAAMPKIEAHLAKIRVPDADIRAVQADLMELGEQRGKLALVDQQVRQFLDGLPEPPRDIDPADLESAVRDLLEKRREYLDTLISYQDRYFELLVDLDSLDKRITQEVGEYAEFIDARVLWIRSAEPLGISDFRVAGEALRWLADLNGWAGIVRCLAADARAHPTVYGVYLLLFLALVFLRRPLQRQLERSAEQAGQPDCRRFAPTMQALVITVLLAVAGPSLFFFFGWRLLHDLEMAEFNDAVGRGLVGLGIFFLNTEFFRQLCRKEGLAEAHFDWPGETCSLLARNLLVLQIVGMPFAFVALDLQAQSNEAWEGSLGRFCLLVVLAVLTVVMHRVFRPKAAMFANLMLEDSRPLVYRLRYVWYALAVGSPLTLAGLAVAGYTYTTFHLLGPAVRTLWLLLGVLALSALLLRWLTLRRRALTHRQAEEAARTAAQQESGEDKPSGSTPIPIAAEPKIDVRAISRQSRQLIHWALVIAMIVGLWIIWEDVVPALGILDDVELWQTEVQGRVEPVTLSHLLLALLTLCITFLAVRDIPGLLELILLERLPMDYGARYASLTMFRYAIMIAGAVIAAKTLGIRWEQYQWLVAAATFGLGFGLQEILANFVSGLILLAERPIRVGDIVTVQGVTGAVSNIRMRATIVTNWDRQDFIVPNKEFVTGRVINWTLSNSVNRVLVKVRVAHGTDAERARDLLLDVARKNPLIMDDPAPIATLEQFTENTLEFVLRCYLPDMSKRLGTIHELHAAVHRTFKEAGIEIAAPQQDIRIRTVPPPTAPGGQPDHPFTPPPA